MILSDDTSKKEAARFFHETICHHIPEDRKAKGKVDPALN
jgi:hypothetical protein